MPDLVVIMSVYIKDRLEFVQESVQSILEQTFRNFHYFLICDGPVAPEVDGYLTSLKDDRIRLFRLEKNQGLAHALNYLLEIIMKNPEYKFIARMDADDISMSERLKTQRDYLILNRVVTCVGSWYEEIDESGKLLSRIQLPVDHESLRKRFYTRTPFAHSSVMYSRIFIETAGFYPTHTLLMEDNFLWGKALYHGLKLGNIPDYLLKFRIDKDFYRRRSGLKYGWHYINTRIKVLKLINAPAYIYLAATGLGIIRMIPGRLFRLFYDLNK